MSNEIIPIAEGEIVLYQPDENTHLEVRISNDTVWLTRNQIATLFGRDVKTIGKHINNALREELSFSVVAKNATTAATGATSHMIDGLSSMMSFTIADTRSTQTVDIASQPSHAWAHLQMSSSRRCNSQSFIAYH